MPRIHITRYTTRIRMGAPAPVLMLGDCIGSGDLEVDFLPRKGELITVHPDGFPSEKSWTGEVTAVQHVIYAPNTKPPLACLTVRDERESST